MAQRRFLGLSLLCAVLLCVGARPYLPIDCNVESSGNQFHLRSSVLNTPIIRASMYQGTNTWDASGYTASFRYGKNENASSMVTITGVVSSSTIDFICGTNDLAAPVEDWYAAVLVTSGTVVMSYSKGLITIDRSPEVSSPRALAKTTAINGSEYGPFTGDFSGWPFLTSTNSLRDWALWPAVTNVLPANDLAYTLGAATARWDAAYFDSNSVYLGSYHLTKARAEAWDNVETNYNTTSNQVAAMLGSNYLVAADIAGLASEANLNTVSGLVVIAQTAADAGSNLAATAITTADASSNSAASATTAANAASNLAVTAQTAADNGSNAAVTAQGWIGTVSNDLDTLEGRYDATSNQVASMLGSNYLTAELDAAAIGQIGVLSNQYTATSNQVAAMLGSNYLTAELDLTAIGQIGVLSNQYARTSNQVAAMISSNYLTAEADTLQTVLTQSNVATKGIILGSGSSFAAGEYGLIIGDQNNGNRKSIILGNGNYSAADMNMLIGDLLDCESLTRSCLLVGTNITATKPHCVGMGETIVLNGSSYGYAFGRNLNSAGKNGVFMFSDGRSLNAPDHSTVVMAATNGYYFYGGAMSLNGTNLALHGQVLTNAIDEMGRAWINTTSNQLVITSNKVAAMISSNYLTAELDLTAIGQVGVLSNQYAGTSNQVAAMLGSNYLTAELDAAAIAQVGVLSNQYAGTSNTVTAMLGSNYLVSADLTPYAPLTQLNTVSNLSAIADGSAAVSWQGWTISNGTKLVLFKTRTRAVNVTRLFADFDSAVTWTTDVYVATNLTQAGALMVSLTNSAAAQAETALSYTVPTGRVVFVTIPNNPKTTGSGAWSWDAVYP